MPLFSFEGTSPKVDQSAWIAPNATVIGDVTVEADASIWYGVVIRADFGPIVIRAGANIQDNAVIHTNGDGVVEIGAGATIAHSVVMHGTSVGEQSIVGNGAVVQDGARIGRRCMVGAGALIAPGTVVPDETLAVGAPAKEFKPLSTTATAWIDLNPGVYQELARRHRDGAKPL
ncbi:MAG: gamma carbonic anhydrase family protein [Sciscionella sp.]|nr:gamma carbonic anhydrase family protein [Sciscionella sp.]